MKLELAGVTKSFGAHRVLDDISLNLPSVHAFVLIGPSGGGKSTLLRILAGLEHPDSGRVSIDGAALPGDEESLRQYRRGAGTVFQAYNLFPHLSALDNILLPLEKAHGLAHAEAESRAMDTLRRFQLEAHARKKPAQLSGGQKQRVAIARAVAIKPRLLLFDEPTSALDPEMTAEVLEMIEELKREGRDLVLVTHEMAFARVAADHVAYLADGKILESGAPDEVFATPHSESCRRFLGKILRY
ncbi:MAG TPA: amino acid ABC transporter ATP-binding protein [Chthoniobacteraceae bacterium]|jgi:polar amino acid transport system ATP-binding protein|nr:amino acid ABC transporter ATP-binding protein [Chthoniobacteraceae bacterium]